MLTRVRTHNDMIALPVKPENARKVLDVLCNEPIVSRKKIIEKTGFCISKIYRFIFKIEKIESILRKNQKNRNIDFYITKKLKNPFHKFL